LIGPLIGFFRGFFSRKSREWTSFHGKTGLWVQSSVEYPQIVSALFGKLMKQSVYLQEVPNLNKAQVDQFFVEPATQFGKAGEKE